MVSNCYFLLVVCLLVANGSYETPDEKATEILHFKWSQDYEYIYIILPTVCVNKKLQLQYDHFYLECEDGLLNMTLWDDINIEKSQCQPKMEKIKGYMYEGELCTLKKRFPHYSEQLIIPEERKIFRPYIGVDWSRWQPSPFDDTVKPLDEWYERKGIIRLTDKNFAEVTKKKNLLVAHMDFEWCRSCTSSSKELFIELSESLKSKKLSIILGYADLNTEYMLRRRFNFTCMLSCHFFVYSHFDGTYKKLPYWTPVVDKLVDMIMPYTAQHLRQLNSVEDAKALQKTFGFEYTVFWAEFSSNLTLPFEAFKKTAFLIRGDVVFAFRLDVNQTEAPEAYIFGYGNKSFIFGGEFNEHALEDFVRKYSFPLISTYYDELEKNLELAKLPYVIFYLHSDDYISDILPIIKRMAIDLQGQLIFVQYRIQDSNIKFMGQKWGINIYIESAFVIYDSILPKSPKYVYEGFFTQAEMSQFVQAYFSGSLSPSLLTEPVPKTWDRGTVKKIVRRSAKKIFKQKEDVFLLLYTEKDPKWQRVRAALENVAHSLKEIDGIFIAKMDRKYNFYVDMFPEVEKKKSTALFISPGKPYLLYSKKLTSKKILQYLKKKSKVVRSNWNIISKAAIELDKASNIEIEKEAKILSQNTNFAIEEELAFEEALRKEMEELKQSLLSKDEL